MFPLYDVKMNGKFLYEVEKDSIKEEVMWKFFKKKVEENAIEKVSISDLFVYVQVKLWQLLFILFLVYRIVYVTYPLSIFLFHLSHLYRLNRMIFGMETAFWFHVVNVVLHVIASILFTKICSDVIGLRRKFCLLAGIFFAIHPIHTESESFSYFIFYFYHATWTCTHILYVANKYMCVWIYSSRAWFSPNEGNFQDIPRIKSLKLIGKFCVVLVCRRMTINYQIVPNYLQCILN